MMTIKSRNLNRAKFLSFVGMFLLLFSVYGAYALDGSGTMGDPFQINTCVELNETRNNLTAYYTLMGNIDCSDTVNWDGNAGWTPIAGDFSGVIFGDDNSITDLYINRPDTSGQGIFENLSGTLYNLNIIDADFTVGNHSGILASVLSSGNVWSVDIITSFLNFTAPNSENTYGVGLVAGISTGLTSNIDIVRIINCNIENYDEGATYYTGGLVGELVDGNLDVSRVLIDGLGFNTRDDITLAGLRSGGVVGYITGGDLSVVNTTISGLNMQQVYGESGGVVGRSASGSTIFMNSVSVDGYIIEDDVDSNGACYGGLVGWVDGSYNITNTYSTVDFIVPYGDYFGGLISCSEQTATSYLSYSYYAGSIALGVGTNVGGIFSEQLAQTEILELYIDSDLINATQNVAGLQSLDGIQNLTTVEMQNASTWSAFDIGVWTIENGNYPTLSGSPVPCTPSWSCAGYSACDVDDEADCNAVTDLNSCGFVYEGDFSEFDAQDCNYCSYSVSEDSLSSCYWSVDSFFGSVDYTYVDDNYADCCNVTNISGDCTYSGYNYDYVNSEGYFNVEGVTSSFCRGQYDSEDTDNIIVDGFNKILVGMKDLAPLIGIAFVIAFLSISAITLNYAFRRK